MRMHLSASQKLVDREMYILRDLAQEDRRNVSPGVVRNSRATTIRVAKLHVRAPLPDK